MLRRGRDCRDVKHREMGSRAARLAAPTKDGGTAQSLVPPYESLSSTFFVMRVTAGSLPRRPKLQSVLPTVTTVPPRE